MIYHIFKRAPQIANPKIKEFLRFSKRFCANVHGTRGASYRDPPRGKTDRGGGRAPRRGVLRAFGCTGVGRERLGRPKYAPALEATISRIIVKHKENQGFWPSDVSRARPDTQRRI